jgi:hypothetical protein
MIAALILPLAVMDFAEAIKDNDKKDKKLKHKDTLDAQKLIAKIDAKNKQKHSQEKVTYSEKSLQDTKLPTLGPDWEVKSVDYVGINEPFELTKIVVTAQLIDKPNNPHQCQYPTYAVFTFDAVTGKVLGRDIPNKNECEKPITLSKRTESANLPDFIP